MRTQERILQKSEILINHLWFWVPGPFLSADFEALWEPCKDSLSVSGSSPISLRALLLRACLPAVMLTLAHPHT